jgi:hypothetical protein
MGEKVTFEYREKVTFEYIDSAIPPNEFARRNGGEVDIMSDPLAGAGGYENAANYACKVLLAAARRDPVAFKAALDEYRKDVFSDEIEKLLTEDERKEIMEGRYGVTGFQWGWAVQTAAYLTEQAPVGNPAVLTFSVAD